MEVTLPWDFPEVEPMTCEEYFSKKREITKDVTQNRLEEHDEKNNKKADLLDASRTASRCLCDYGNGKFRERYGDFQWNKVSVHLERLLHLFVWNS